MKTFIFSVIGFCFILTGCASIKSVSQNIWGSSITHLETARVDSLYKTIPCEYQECYDAIKVMLDEGSYTVFQERPAKGLLVIMGVQEALNTTEVGIFLTPLSSEETEIEVASLSTPAKKTFAEVLFTYLDNEFIHRELNTLDLE